MGAGKQAAAHATWCMEAGEQLLPACLLLGVCGFHVIKGCSTAGERSCPGHGMHGSWSAASGLLAALKLGGSCPGNDVYGSLLAAASRGMFGSHALDCNEAEGQLPRFPPT